VVHRDYGIGKFAGLQTINVGRGEQEVMKILYEENDVLYVNLNFLNRVQKYSSREGHVPKLTRLGTPQWDRLKERARKRIKDIARDLIALYARRKHEPGFGFSADSHWQRELEASFMFEDTPDQARATMEVKNDMMQNAPMDRLVCGDVGFGKTEVAVRAAFKSVLDGKQVAVLVPTTILAQQHDLTFMDRLQRYAVRVESLTRFKSKKAQREVLARLQSGAADIVIGTHRLLSKDVHFKDLGLLIIDEEHRFGVSAKEKLRALRASVDTLTMTATPIPRTLQFSLLGARDLSIMNTPPRNRLPIITEIVQFDVRLIREAILREMHRGGQIYFIHDRIQTMDEILQLLRRHIPEARVHAAHGQMRGHELEKTMLEFLEGHYDVLVCTKIIESGIDIPSVNTLIVNRADRFGLAELYQLRGRVGRSNVQAYAYLLTPPLTSLPRETLRRLQAIQEFTELGSGFNLAMRDMEIRGAGNLLGAEQSGFILDMGFEMYQRIVEEAVNELREEEFSDLTVHRGSGPVTETVLETDLEALIPDVYISSDSERLDVYRRLYLLRDHDSVNEIAKELEDRFGEYPPEVENLLKTVRVKLAGEALGFQKIQLSQRTCVIWMPPTDQKSFYEEGKELPSGFQKLTEAILRLKDHHPRFRQDGKQLKLTLKLPESIPNDRRLDHIRELLEHLGTIP
ncbi:MAG: transcription-repair coupling factor, partial [Ignavibacteriales bacterium]|nr:transcription-repair coupling factor [Ignavibacteriales bacterium]